MRNAGEQSQRLGLVVLVPNLTVLRDGGRVIVAGSNHRASEPTPVGTTIHHVKRDRRGLLSNQVTVEDVGEIRTNVTWAAALGATPRVVRSALELRQEVRLSWRLLGEVCDIVLDIVRDIFAVCSGAFIEVAAPAGRVAVYTGDIDVAGCVGFKVIRPRKGALEIVSLPSIEQDTGWFLQCWARCGTQAHQCRHLLRRLLEVACNLQQVHSKFACRRSSIDHRARSQSIIVSG